MNNFTFKIERNRSHSPIAIFERFVLFLCLKAWSLYFITLHSLKALQITFALIVTMVTVRHFKTSPLVGPLMNRQEHTLQTTRMTKPASGGVVVG